MLDAFRGLSKKQALLVIAVLSVYFFSPTQGIISSVLGNIGQTYPDVAPGTLTYLVTMNNVAAIVSALFFGVVAGHKIKFKTLSMIAFVLFIIGGGLPAILPLGTPFWVLMLTRVVMGVARGCFVPMVQIILCGMFKDETARSTWFGIGNIFFNLGVTLGTTIAGYLGLIDWRMCFVFYIFAFIPMLLFMFFFKEEDAGIEKKEKGEKQRLGAVVWIHMILYFCTIIMTQTLWNYASICMVGRGIASSTVGTVLSTFPVVGIVAGLLLPLFFKKVKNYVMTLGIGITTLGFVAMTIGFSTDTGVALFYVGSGLIGFGGVIVTVGCPLSMSLRVAPAVVALVLSLNEVFHNLGSFAASPFSQVVFLITGTSDPQVIWAATAVFGVLLAVIGLIVGIRLTRLDKAAKVIEEQ